MSGKHVSPYHQRGCDGKEVLLSLVMRNSAMKCRHEPPQSTIMHIISGYWLSQAVRLAARIRIADAIGSTSATLEEIAQRTSTRPDELQRAMRALTCHGFFKQSDDGAFAQTPLSEALKSDVPGACK